MVDGEGGSGKEVVLARMVLGRMSGMEGGSRGVGTDGLGFGGRMMGRGVNRVGACGSS